MDYQEKEFYDVIEKKREEIKSSDISDEEKAERYMLINGFIQKYTKMQIISLRNKLFIAGLNEVQQNIDEALEEIISTAKVILPNLGEIVKKQRENKNILPPPNYTTFYRFSNN